MDTITINNETIDVQWVCKSCEQDVIDGEHVATETVVDYDDFSNTHRIGFKPCAICGSHRGAEGCSRYAITNN